MSSLAVNSLVPKLAPPPSLIDRTHYSGPGGTIHHSHSSKGGGKHSIALTALTLLAFLFFLNILQNCIQDHMQEMNSTQQVIIVQARTPELREAQKRKGEIEFLNSTMAEESRNNPEILKTKAVDHYMTQIPVKLRTNEKAVKP